MKNTKKVTTAKTATKEVAPVVTKTTKTTNEDLVVLGQSTYHYVRNFLRPLFIEANITMKWVKEPTGYACTIKVKKADLAKAKKVYADYIKKEDTVEMITLTK